MSKPSEKYSQPVLDSVLSDSGAMPAARLGIRLQALILDCVFVILFSLIAIGQFALPQAFPNVYTEVEQWNLSHQLKASKTTVVAGPSDTRAIAKGVCASILGSAATLIQ